MIVHWPLVWKSAHLRMRMWQRSVLTVLWPFVWKGSDLRILMWRLVTIIWVWCTVTCNRQAKDGYDKALIIPPPMSFHHFALARAEACCFNVFARRMVDIVTQQTTACPHEIAWAVKFFFCRHAYLDHAYFAYNVVVNFENQLSQASMVMHLISFNYKRFNTHLK